MANITLRLPSEGLFILDRRAAIPLLFSRKNGQISRVDLDQNEINRNGIDFVLKKQGFTPEQIKSIPDFNPADVNQQLNAELKGGGRISVQEALSQPVARSEDKVVSTDIGGAVAGSVGSKQSPQIASSQIPAPQQQNQFAGSVSTNTNQPSEDEIQAEITRFPGLNRDAAIGNIMGRRQSQGGGAQGGTGQLGSGIAGGAQKQENFTDINSLPDSIKNNDLFKQLNPEQQEMLAFSYNAMQASSVLTQIKAQEALEEATKLADPLFKQQIRLAQDGLTRSIGTLIANDASARKEIDTKISDIREDLKTKGDRLTADEFQAKLKEAEGLATTKDQAIRVSGSREAQVGADIHQIENRIADLKQDLENNKGDIDIDTQKALQRQLRQYQDQLKQTQQGAVDAGLGFSSIRTEAEQRLKEELNDISESTRRQAARQLRDIEISTGRGERDLGLQQQDIERQNHEANVELARAIEKRVGFDNIPSDIRLTLEKSFTVLGQTFTPLVTGQGEEVRSEMEAQEEERQQQLKQQREDIERERTRAERETETARKELERQTQEKKTQLAREGEETLGTTNLPETGVDALGGIQGTLEQQKTERIGAIQQSLMDNQANLGGIQGSPVGIQPTTGTQQTGSIQEVETTQQGIASVDPKTKILTLPNGQQINPQDTQTYNDLLRQHRLKIQHRLKNPFKKERSV